MKCPKCGRTCGGNNSGVFPQSEKARRRTVTAKRKKKERNKKYYKVNKILLKVKRFLRNFYKNPSSESLEFQTEEAIWLDRNLPHAPVIPVDAVIEI